jgi:catechol 2,3-dioxygenase-like lactoylglutathione lyase family enzyme/ketosteroid isomerase-like protein
MTVALQTTGVHHLTLRSTDLARARDFYGGTLGFPIVLQTPVLFIALAGATAVAVRGPDPQTPDGDRFDPFRVGLDHIALLCGREAELERVAAALDAADVPSTGIRVDPTLQRRYVAFKDPDGIAWELYMSPNVAIEVVERYLDALKTGALSDVPLAADVTFESPLSARVKGREGVLEALRSMLPAVLGVTVRDHLADGEFVATRFDLTTPFGEIEVFDRFRVVNGELAEIRPYYDPRVIAEAMKAGA